MRKKTSIANEEILRVYILIEELHSFLHQPMHYRDPESVSKWLDKTKLYPELAEVFYKIVWKWLPKYIQTEIEEGLTDGWYDLSKARRAILFKRALTGKKVARRKGP